MSEKLDRLIAEKREEFRPEDVDWSRVEGELFARVEADRRRARAHAAREQGHVWAAAAAALAAAIVVLVLVARPRPQRAAVEPEGDGVAAALMAVRGSGDLLVNGAPAAIGASLHLGDVVEGRGVQATFVRPGRVTVVVEAGARAVVARVEEPLVLTLDRGAVDAQVVPVPSGEAFAVDVDGSRVAVHGTHLRVAREGGHVTVDLSEGVVSVGRAPRVGSVLGTLVTAPAHAEFAAADVRGTMRVSHDPGSVREPESGFDTAVAPASRATVAGAVAAPEPARAPALPSEAHLASSAPPSKNVPAPYDSVGAVESPAAPTVDTAASPAPPPEQTSPDPDADNTVASAVRHCMSTHPRPPDVSVAVSTTLHLWVNAQGNVRSARFEPPVAPDVNTCAAEVIYRTRFAKHGSVNIRVDYKD
jgi:ferric-dicitrate binding protein FerR (iron transport regulator)